MLPSLPLVHSPDPVSAHLWPIPHVGDSFIFSRSLYLIPVSAASSVRVSQNSLFEATFALSALGYSKWHLHLSLGTLVLVHLSWQPLQSILLSGPFCHRKKPCLLLAFLPFPYSQSPSTGSLPRVLDTSALIHQSFMVLKLCASASCPAHPEAPLPCWYADICHAIMLILKINEYLN